MKLKVIKGLLKQFVICIMILALALLYNQGFVGLVVYYFPQIRKWEWFEAAYLMSYTAWGMILTFIDLTIEKAKILWHSTKGNKEKNERKEH